MHTTRVQEARALVGWASAVLRQLDVAATKKAVGKLLECQVGGLFQAGGRTTAELLIAACAAGGSAVAATPAAC